MPSSLRFLNSAAATHVGVEGYRLDPFEEYIGFKEYIGNRCSLCFQSLKAPILLKKLGDIPLILVEPIFRIMTWYQITLLTVNQLVKLSSKRVESLFLARSVIRRPQAILQRSRPQVAPFQANAHVHST